MSNDEPLDMKLPAGGGDLPPVPVDLPANRQMPYLSEIQRAIDTERFQAYSRISRIIHFGAAGLLLLHDFLTPRVLNLYELSGKVVFSVIPRERPWLDAWLSTERLIPLFIVYQTVLFHYLLPEKILSARTKLVVEGWIDLLWTTVAVSVTGGVRSPFVFLYLLVVLNSAPAQSRNTSIAKAAAATLLVAASFVISNPEGDIPATALIWPISFLWMASYLAGAFENISRSLNEQLLRETVRDDTTGLYTLKFFAALPDRRTDWPYAIVLFDADHLKELNDTHGHELGTELICHAAEAIRAAAREGDVCARLGGDEFIVRLKGSTREGAIKYAERVRELAAKLPVELPTGEVFPVQLSAGIATCPADGRQMPEIIRKADLALYASKNSGRNRITVWSAGLQNGTGSQFLGSLKVHQGRT